MHNLKSIFKSMCNISLSKETRKDCIDRFTEAVARHEKEQRKIKRAKFFANLADSISYTLFGGPQIAYSNSRRNINNPNIKRIIYG